MVKNFIHKIYSCSLNKSHSFHLIPVKIKVQDQNVLPEEQQFLQVLWQQPSPFVCSNQSSNRKKSLNICTGWWWSKESPKKSQNKKDSFKYWSIPSKPGDCLLDLVGSIFLLLIFPILEACNSLKL